MILAKERKQIVEYGRKLITSNLTKGAGGNLSIYNRDENLVAISPSGIEYFDLHPEDIVITNPQGVTVDGTLKPSSELGFHLSLYEKRADFNAVVHTHSTYATTFACLNMEIPAVHYLVAFSGKKVPVAPYATFGTKELAQNVADSLKGYNALLLANHGLVTGGLNINSAFNTAEEIEFVAEVYYKTLNLGKPTILPDSEMDTVIEKFRTYGKQNEGNVKIKKSVECWIYNRETGKYLLLKCPETKAHGKYWQPVTGGREERESGFSACIREVEEETGLKLQEKNLEIVFETFVVPVPERNMEIHKPVYTIKINTKKIRLSKEHVDYIWAEPGIVQDLLLWESNKRSFKKVMETYHG